MKKTVKTNKGVYRGVVDVDTLALSLEDDEHIVEVIDPPHDPLVDPDLEKVEPAEPEAAP